MPRSLERRQCDSPTLERRTVERRVSTGAWTGEDRRRVTGRRRDMRHRPEFALKLTPAEIDSHEGRSRPIRSIAMAMAASACMYSVLWITVTAIFR